jgi:putative transposase
VHHVWNRGNRRQSIFIDERDRRFFLRLLAEVTARHRLHCLSYCLMTNHFHLVIETPYRTLGSGMRELGGRYAQWFNGRHETGGGHMFQERFGSKPVVRDEQFAQLLRYVARNPVRARLCDRPEDWPWSSHRALLSHDRHSLVAVDRVAAHLGTSGVSSDSYAELFAPDGPLRHIDPDKDPWTLRPSLAQILVQGSNAEALQEARREGYRLAEIADHIGVSEATVSRRLKRVA